MVIDKTHLQWPGYVMRMEDYCHSKIFLVSELVSGKLRSTTKEVQGFFKTFISKTMIYFGK